MARVVIYALGQAHWWCGVKHRGRRGWTLSLFKHVSVFVWTRCGPCLAGTTLDEVGVGASCRPVDPRLLQKNRSGFHFVKKWCIVIVCVFPKVSFFLFASQGFNVGRYDEGLDWGLEPAGAGGAGTAGTSQGRVARELSLFETAT